MCCEAYFRVCGIDPQEWVDTAVVNFTGAAALWLEWSQAHRKCTRWELFCVSVLEKFGRSKFQHLLRKFSRLKQTGSVLEYAEQFNIMMHSLLAHHNSWDPLFFTTHFVDGLFHEIKIAVVLHRPQDLESAVVLAELQEEVLEMEHPEQEAATPHRANSPGASTGRFLSRSPLTVTVPPVLGIGRPSISSPSPTPLETRRGLDMPSRHRQRLQRSTTSCGPCELSARRAGYVSPAVNVGGITMCAPRRCNCKSCRNWWACSRFLLHQNYRKSPRRAQAWGQANSKWGGNVMGTAPSPATTGSPAQPRRSQHE